MTPTIGRIVHFRVGGTDESPDLRPAIIVRVWGDTCVNLQVFNDGDAPGVQWHTSVTLGDDVLDWRWPAR